MFGAAVDVPRMTETLGLRMALDAMLFGASVVQTKNLEDGQNPKAMRITAGASLTYRWKPSVDLQFAYELNYGSLEFGAPTATSMRGHTGTGVARTDMNHTITAGLGKVF